MNKQAIANQLTAHYSAFVNYINDLTPDEFLYSAPQKWSAGQQISHIVICVKPIVQVLSMDKAAIAQNFGQSARPGRDYDTLLAEYEEKLKQGGKAPTRFLPEPVSLEERARLSETLTTSIQQVCSKMDSFTEQDLDTLNIPHPLMGDLTVREMLYNVIYHVDHHQRQAEQNLAYR